MAPKAKQFIKASSEAAASAQSIVIAQPTTLSVGLEIKGRSDLIQHAFSQKAVEEMLRKHMGISVQREKKNPRQCIEDATIRNVTGRVCVATTAFKKAMVAAASEIKSLKKTQLRMAIFVEGQSVPITYGEMVPRMDMVRLGGIGRTPDVRFRPSFVDWSARMVIQFSDTLGPQTVVDLLMRAGRSGVGEWRPEKGGTFGTFNVVRHIEDPKEIAEVQELCEPPLVALRIPDWAMDADIDPELLAKAFGVPQKEEDIVEMDDEQKAAALAEHGAGLAEAKAAHRPVQNGGSA